MKYLAALQEKKKCGVARKDNMPAIVVVVGL
jgi:hypothetical protein